MREGGREAVRPPVAAALHISKLGLLFGGAFQPEEEEEEGRRTKRSAAAALPLTDRLTD